MKRKLFQVHYHPVYPYIFKGGKYPGESAERLMFTDYPYLLKLWEIRKEKGEGRGLREDYLGKRLSWLMEKGEDRKTKIPCPKCLERPVELFTAKFSKDLREISVGSFYVSCYKCKHLMYLPQLYRGKAIQVFDFKFSSLKYFGNKVMREKLFNLYKEVYGLPKRLTKQRALEFFKE